MTNKMKGDLYKSLAHTAEIAVFGTLGLVALYMLKDNADVMDAVKNAVVNIIPVLITSFMAKFNRTTDKTPGGDYVNDI